MIGEVNAQQGDVDSSLDEMRGGSIMIYSLHGFAKQHEKFFILKQLYNKLLESSFLITLQFFCVARVLILNL